MICVIKECYNAIGQNGDTYSSVMCECCLNKKLLSLIVEFQVDTAIYNVESKYE